MSALSATPVTPTGPTLPSVEKYNGGLDGPITKVATTVVPQLPAASLACTKISCGPFSQRLNRRQRNVTEDQLRLRVPVAIRRHEREPRTIGTDRVDEPFRGHDRRRRIGGSSGHPDCWCRRVHPDRAIRERRRHHRIGHRRTSLVDDQPDRRHRPEPASRISRPHTHQVRSRTQSVDRRLGNRRIQTRRHRHRARRHVHMHTSIDRIERGNHIRPTRRHIRTRRMQRHIDRPIRRIRCQRQPRRQRTRRIGHDRHDHRHPRAPLWLRRTLGHEWCARRCRAPRRWRTPTPRRQAYGKGRKAIEAPRHRSCTQRR